MHGLVLILLTGALLAPATGARAQWAAIGKGAAVAIATERAAAAAAKLAALEKAAAAAAKAAAAERAALAGTQAATGAKSGLATAKVVPGTTVAKSAGLSGEGAAARAEARIARDMRDFGVRRGEDGRFVLNAGRGAAQLVRSRVFDAVRQAPPGVFARGEDGRYLSLGFAGGDAPKVRAAAEAVTDTIGTALHKAANDLRSRAAIGASVGAPVRAPPVPPSGPLDAEVKALLDALHDPKALKHAQGLSISRAAGAPGVSLREVDDVVLVEQHSKPSSLLVQLTTNPSRPAPVVARVNLDEILKRIDKTGF